MTGLYTIRAGQRVAIWDARGRVRFVDGPRRRLLLGQTVQPLIRHTAGPDEYLVIRALDGRTTHMPGPAAAWFNPLVFRDVQVAKGLPIDSHEAVVVYRRTAAQVERRVVRGPALFVPTPDEWLHEFRWHGSDPTHPSRKVPRGLCFTKLRIIPDQMYLDVEGVRTADDAQLTIKLMLFFELRAIEVMLDQTHDVTADFINAVTADVIDLAGSGTFESFKQRIERLNDLATYTNLCQLAARIGYAINKVVYRGYAAGEKLQAMHDSAIEARTGLKLQAETEEQAQALADLKLAREGERAARQRALAEEQAEHQLLLARRKHEEELREAQREREAEAAARRQHNEIELGRRQALDEQRLHFLRGMQALQVDLTRYLVARYRSPDRLIQVAGAPRPQVHVHDN